MKVPLAAPFLSGMRESGQWCFFVFRTIFHIRPLPQDSAWSKGWECNLVLVELIQRSVVSAHESRKLEGYDSFSGELQPFLVEPVVDLNDPDLCRIARCKYSSQ